MARFGNTIPRNQSRTKDKSWSNANLLTPVILLLAVPRRLFCFGSLITLDVACCYLWLFSLNINFKIGKTVVKFKTSW